MQLGGNGQTKAKYSTVYIQGVSFFHVHIFTKYGGMRTTLYGNFVLCKFKFCKKLQRFEFICEKTIFAVKSLFFTKISWKLA